MINFERVPSTVLPSRTTGQLARIPFHCAAKPDNRPVVDAIWQILIFGELLNSVNNSVYQCDVRLGLSMRRHLLHPPFRVKDILSWWWLVSFSVMLTGRGVGLNGRCYMDPSVHNGSFFNLAPIVTAVHQVTIFGDINRRAGILLYSRSFYFTCKKLEGWCNDNKLNENPV